MRKILFILTLLTFGLFAKSQEIGRWSSKQVFYYKLDTVTNQLIHLSTFNITNIITVTKPSITVKCLDCDDSINVKLTILRDTVLKLRIGNIDRKVYHVINQYKELLFVESRLHNVITDYAIIDVTKNIVLIYAKLSKLDNGLDYIQK